MDAVAKRPPPQRSAQLSLAQILAEEYRVLDGALFMDVGSVLAMVLVNVVLFGVLWFTNLSQIPSNWPRDPFFAWIFFLDVLLVPPMPLLLLVACATRAWRSNIVTTMQFERAERESRVDLRSSSINVYASAWFVFVILLQSIVVLVQIIVWLPINLVFISDLCAQTPQCGQCGATECDGTLAGGARWQFLVALLCRFFTALLAGYYLYYMENISRFHSASMHLPRAVSIPLSSLPSKSASPSAA
jgi:hypothetical protein